MALVFINGKFLNSEKAAIPVDNRSFRYGDGFFETIKCIKGFIPLWKYHKERLFDTLSRFSFQSPSYFTEEYLLSIINELIKKNQHLNLARIRITIYRGEGGIYDPINNHPNLLVQSWALNPENNKLNENGLVLGLYHGGFKAADSFANLKSNNYLIYLMAAMEAKRQHWNDALVFNHKNNLADATIANLWIINGDKVITPPLSDGPVAGTMRRYLLENISVTGSLVEEGTIEPVDLFQADEVFLSNAIYGIRWVKQCGERSFRNVHTQRLFTELIKPLWETTK